MIRPALSLLAFCTFVLGSVYPAAICGLARLFFPAQATGSLVRVHGRTIGSALVGQDFADPRYFRGRPSATAGFPYNPLASGGSNLGPTNPRLLRTVRVRLDSTIASLPGAGPVPIDFLTASGSGLDPDVSPEAALMQVPRVAAARGLPASAVRTLVERLVERCSPVLFGQDRVNVLLLNVSLDTLGLTRTGW